MEQTLWLTADAHFFRKEGSRIIELRLKPFDGFEELAKKDGKKIAVVIESTPKPLVTFCMDPGNPQSALQDTPASAGSLLADGL